MAYDAITIEGGIFPADLLDRIGSGDEPGQRPQDFRLAPGGRLSDEIQSAFSDVRAYWDAFQRRSAHSHESRTTLTRESWAIPLFEALGWTDLVFQRAAAQVGGESYALSHRGGEDPEAPPVHIVGLGQALDRKEGARRSPHALVQEYLNRSDTLWGLVTNGERLRLLRDSERIAHPSYVEFDLRGLVEGNRYSEFALLYRLLHRTRFPHTAADAPECWLERTYQAGIEQGGRVREHLRDGVEQALTILGTALLEHEDSEELRAAFRAGHLDAPRYYRQLLRLIYRLLFLFVAEERRLIFPPDSGREELQAIYARYYALGRLRDRAERRFAGDRHGDLWQGLLETFRVFRDTDTAARLGLSALDGELFGPTACADLEEAGCANADLLRAIYHLSTFFEKETKVTRRVNYAALDVEELGSVYESLLDYHPQVEPEGGSPRFALVSGAERKTTGSYYTPPSLVHELVESALVPVVEERLAAAGTGEARERALLGLRVVDPASGSGHFLLAAARRIARELAKARSGEAEPAPEEYRHALRDVIRNCVYAVDKNPLAVDLCKVALWIEGHSAGLPLSFLDGHVKCGDSLVGVLDLEVLAGGIPDDAYTAVAGDDRKVASALKKRNKQERARSEEGYQQRGLRLERAVDLSLGTLAPDFAELGGLEERTPADVQAKAGMYDALRGEGGRWWVDKVACDLWTAAFFTPLEQPASGPELVPTSDTVRRYLEQPQAADGRVVGNAVELSERLRFFHWSLEFPDVFDRGGFDVVLGNPPFMGGRKVSEVFGENYRNCLAATHPLAGGAADLSAHFFRRGFSILGTRANQGMIATNSIAEGDTREGGLAQVLKDGGKIISARKFVRWPGSANVEVVLITIHRGPWDQSCIIDGKSVKSISSRLDDEPEQEPRRLRSNSGKTFIGSYILGMGFVLKPDEAHCLIGHDSRNRDCLFPYLTGEDLNLRPDQSPSRWVISFDERSESEAKSYPDLWSIINERVWPERKEKDARKYPRMVNEWWKHWNNRRELYVAVHALPEALARSRVSEYHMLASVPTDWVYSEQVVIFALAVDPYFALLQSNVHEAWVWRFASSLESRNRYTPTDCFDTFPFPQNPAHDLAAASRAGRDYIVHRQRVMAERYLGLTKTYNLFHSPNIHDTDIARLRELHRAMDIAILACYGWQDVQPGHGFYQNERGQTRYTISPDARREVLIRLFDLNLAVATKEEPRNPVERRDRRQEVYQAVPSEQVRQPSAARSRRDGEL